MMMFDYGRGEGGSGRDYVISEGGVGRRRRRRRRREEEKRRKEKRREREMRGKR